MMTLVETSPVHAGDVVHVTQAVHLASGRILRRGRYTVLRMEGRRAVVAYRPDCRRLGTGFNPQQGEAGWIVPPCEEPAHAYLEAGEYTVYAEAPAPIPNH